jgi:hypothetical protein
MDSLIHVTLNTPFIKNPDSREKKSRVVVGDLEAALLTCENTTLLNT